MRSARRSQLISFWLDVAADWKKDRVYLPLADLRRFNVTEAHIANGVADDAWRALMAHEVSFVREMLVRGAPLALRIPGRLGIELCGAVHGGLRFLERIEKAGYDVFRERPVLNTLRLVRGRGAHAGDVAVAARRRSSAFNRG